MLKHVPNIITLSRLLLLPVIIYLLWDNPSVKDGYIAAGVLLIIGISDLIDGWFARRFDAVTNIGKIIDPTADKITIFVSIVMLLHLNRINVILAILIFSREILVTTLRAVASSEGIIIAATTSAKRKTALQMFGVGGLFIYYDFFGASAAYCGNILIILSVIMAWISAIKYFNRFLAKTSKAN